MVKIAPSLLAADFGKLKEELEKIEKSGAEMLHIDIMDGQFVPNISFGFPVLDAVKKYTKLPLDIHLMIKNPEEYIEKFLSYDPLYITIHIEGEKDVSSILKKVKSKGVKAGIAINPGTKLETLTPYLNDIDMILFMTVNPGFGGQGFIKEVLEKMDSANKLIKPVYKNIVFEVDGGINKETGKLCMERGADILVAGSYIFGHSDYKEKVGSLR